MLRRQIVFLLVFVATVLTGHADTGPIKLRDLYEKDLSFSAVALAKEGKEIEVRGFMAPPLKAESQFFCTNQKSQWQPVLFANPRPTGRTTSLLSIPKKS